MFSLSRSRFYITAGLLIIMLVTACKKNDTSGGGAGGGGNTGQVTVAGISGYVYDQNNAAVANTPVKIGTAIVNTNASGFFQARNITVTSTAATVIVEKAGYFKAIKTILPAEGKTAFLEIHLLPKTGIGSFSAGTGGTLSSSSGFTITIPAGAVVNALTNTAYNGTVNVSAQHISAVDPNLNVIMPGDLRGLDSSNSMQLLSTYGMMAVELTGAGGELLQIASGKKATLSITIPATLRASAPATIPLWYFDETKGLWKEEGSAVKSGTRYTGQVSHFSFWNWDIRTNFVIMTCTLKDNTGRPVPYSLVRVTDQANPAITAFGYADSTGAVRAPVPANAQLKLEVNSSVNQCTPGQYFQNFTTTSVNLSLGTIQLPFSYDLATISGTVTNCNGTPLQEGQVVVVYGSQIARQFPVTNGTYSFWEMPCTGPQTVTIYAEDYATLQRSSAPVTLTINPGATIAVPGITACGTPITEYLKYKLDGVPHLFTRLANDFYFIDPMGGNDPLHGLFYNHIRSQNMYGLMCRYDNSNIAPGSTQTMTNLYIFPEMAADSSRTPMQLHITEFGGYGQFVSGNFNGTFTNINPPVVSHTIDCSFRWIH